MSEVVEIIPESTVKYIPGNPSIFLAGTIDLGAGELWQEKIVQRLIDDEQCVNVFNPRRPNMIEFDEITQRYQINWELDKLVWPDLDLIFMYFSPGSKSPITLLEMGFCTAYSDKVILMCNPGFYRYLNVKLTAERFNIPLLPDLDSGYEVLLERLAHIYGF